MPRTKPESTRMDYKNASRTDLIGIIKQLEDFFDAPVINMHFALSLVIQEYDAVVRRSANRRAGRPVAE